MKAFRWWAGVAGLALGVACGADGIVGPDRPSTATSLSLALRASCALTSEGRAYCWGDGGAGQLGNGNSLFSFTPTPVSSESRYVALTSSDVTVCGLVRGGSVECWGSIPSTLLANAASKLVPTPVTSPKPLVSIAAGRSFACGLDAEGNTYCWGVNTRGQLGGVDSLPKDVPTKMGSTMKFASIHAGFWHMCGLTAAGDAFCWGDNSFGELGTDDRVTSRAPRAVAGGLKFRSLTAGSVYTCGVTTADVGYCWGSNFTAQLGDGTTTDRLHPTQVGGALALASIRASRGNSLIGHTCATTKTGSVYCWGNNSAGQLALTTTENCPYATGIYSCARLPVAVPGLSGVLALDLGTSHSCAVVGAGQLMCWGDNSFGELGDGTQAERTGPVVVAGLKIP